MIDCWPLSNARRPSRLLLAVVLVPALGGCGGSPVDRTDLADKYRDLGLDFDERELSDGRDAYTSDSSEEDAFVEMIGDPVTEMSLVLFDVDGADFESTEFELAAFVEPAEQMMPGLRGWIVRQFDEQGAGSWDATEVNGPWTLDAEFSDDWLSTGVGALTLGFERAADE